MCFSVEQNFFWRRMRAHIGLINSISSVFSIPILVALLVLTACPTSFQENVHTFLSVSLCHIFDISFKQYAASMLEASLRFCPSAEKAALIIQTNYRPNIPYIHIFRVMEQLVSTELLSYLLSNNKTSKEQHAYFIRGLSACINHVLQCLYDWTLTCKCKKIDIVLFDFKKPSTLYCILNCFLKSLPMVWWTI